MVLSLTKVSELTISLKLQSSRTVAPAEAVTVSHDKDMIMPLDLYDPEPITKSSFKERITSGAPTRKLRKVMLPSACALTTCPYKLVTKPIRGKTVGENVTINRSAKSTNISLLPVVLVTGRFADCVDVDIGALPEIFSNTFGVTIFSST